MPHLLRSGKGGRVLEGMAVLQRGVARKGTSHERGLRPFREQRTLHSWLGEWRGILEERGA